MQLPPADRTKAYCCGHCMHAGRQTRSQSHQFRKTNTTCTENCDLHRRQCVTMDKFTCFVRQITAWTEISGLQCTENSDLRCTENSDLHIVAASTWRQADSNTTWLTPTTDERLGARQQVIAATAPSDCRQTGSVTSRARLSEAVRGQDLHCCQTG